MKHPWKHRRRATDPPPPTWVEVLVTGLVLILIALAGLDAVRAWRHPEAPTLITRLGNVYEWAGRAVARMR